MARSLYACKTYKIEYAAVGLSGFDQVGKFVQFLRDKDAEGVNGIWISESEDELEIEFATLRRLKRVAKWAPLIQKILDTADKDNGYARLSIF